MNKIKKTLLAMTLGIAATSLLTVSSSAVACDVIYYIMGTPYCVTF